MRLQAMEKVSRAHKSAIGWRDELRLLGIVSFRSAAPEGAIDDATITVCLKAYPDRNLTHDPDYESHS